MPRCHQTDLIFLHNNKHAPIRRSAANSQPNVINLFAGTLLCLILATLAAHQLSALIDGFFAAIGALVLSAIALKTYDYLQQPFPHRPLSNRDPQEHWIVARPWRRTPYLLG
jgi:hypothetical protein